MAADAPAPGSVSGSAAADPFALVLAPDARRAAIVGPGTRHTGPLEDVITVAATLEARRRPRWVVWSAAPALRPLVRAGIRISRSWDIAEAHRLTHGGWRADPALAWAAAHSLSADTIPDAPSGDLFEFAQGPPVADPEELLQPDGHLRADAVAGSWLSTDSRLLAWADAALDCAQAQRARANSRGPRLTATVHSESAASVLCVELEERGLPLDRTRMEELVSGFAGPRAQDEASELAARRARDAEVLRHVPGRESTDLRNPAQVKELLAAIGIDVPNTRKWVLEPFRSVHPVVEALLEWRKAERIATTYGYRWLDTHVGPDDRLRGRWTACDGAGGRMTAENGLHNLPTALRPGVAAHPGFVFVRADLAQIEPRVLAVVSGDPAFAEATRADDLYAPVAQRLRVERPVAKVAVLAAMYGQRSGAAGAALEGLERAYPVAMGHLDRAYAAGTRGEPVRTFGGRLVRTAFGGPPAGSDRQVDAARGRFARNAIIQGAAAELFKAWAATVRAATAPLGAEVVLCLHDELLVHAPVEHADEVAALVDSSLTDAARRWSGAAPVRFVSDTSVIARWSDAKD
jgi:DNA polymerase-1